MYAKIHYSNYDRDSKILNAVKFVESSEIEFAPLCDALESLCDSLREHVDEVGEYRHGEMYGKEDIDAAESEVETQFRRACELESLAEEIEDVSGSWSGCDWAHLICKEVCSAEGDLLAELELDAQCVCDGDSIDDVMRANFSDVDGLIADAALELCKKAIEYADAVRADAKMACEWAESAVENIKSGELDSALSDLEQASRIESEYGDSPTYGGALKSLQDFCEK